MHSFYDTLWFQHGECAETCNVCEEACAERFKDQIENGCSGIKAIHLPERNFHSAIFCNQCGDPVCESYCPTGAISKNREDGVVRIDQDRCLGCGLCALSCPYGGIEYDADKRRTHKCDLCDGEPMCVAACPSETITFRKSRDIVQHLQKDPLRKGTPLCLGCPAEVALRLTLRILGKDTFLFGAPGCAVLTICGMGTQTYTSIPSHMTNMTNLPSTAAGVKRYYAKIGKDVQCVCFAGDGCFADVGFQPLSGAAERGENIINICYDNEGYMNTGIQRSGTTSYLSWTTTTPVGKKRQGKQMPPKNMPLIMAAHDIPYVATATIGYPEDYTRKLLKAMAVKDGMSYIHLLSPCPTGWRSASDSGVDICRLAVETNFFPLWEYEEGTYRFTHDVKRPKPISEYLKTMKKYSHLDSEKVGEVQSLVDKRFATIKSLTMMR
ncbi:MAG: thiamine pyrophosphate-dependent enzyme [Deltaproteobacteria bacterium]|nr:thiamine pyrophosphate-dependent enzyme [Deltaproteobacteria bacterium]